VGADDTPLTGLADNTKAAIMRIGLLEMKNFCNQFFKDVNDKSFLEESSGVADLITTCAFERELH
jgi:glycerol-3-phosphate dehydrogenase (NAD+)